MRLVCVRVRRLFWPLTIQFLASNGPYIGSILLKYYYLSHSIFRISCQNLAIVGLFWLYFFTNKFQFWSHLPPWTSPSASSTFHPGRNVVKSWLIWAKSRARARRRLNAARAGGYWWTFWPLSATLIVSIVKIEVVDKWLCRCSRSTEMEMVKQARIAIGKTHLGNK